MLNRSIAFVWALLGAVACSGPAEDPEHAPDPERNEFGGMGGVGGEGGLGGGSGGAGGFGGGSVGSSTIGAGGDPIDPNCQIKGDGAFCLFGEGGETPGICVDESCVECPTPGGCVECQKDCTCDDHNPCTVDSCYAGVCSYSTINGAACGDTIGSCRGSWCCTSEYTCFKAYEPPIACN